MGHGKDKNDELREDELGQEERRQTLRDEESDEAGGLDDIGSQDERREEGRERH